MANIYEVLSGDYSVKKNGTEISGSPFANDVVAVQTAYNDASSGDTIQLKLGSGANPFNFDVGAKRITCFAAKSITFQGISTDDVKPTIFGGTSPFFINTPATVGAPRSGNTQHSYKFDNIKFTEWGSKTSAEREPAPVATGRVPAAINNVRCKDLVITNCEFYNTNMTNRCRKGYLRAENDPTVSISGSDQYVFYLENTGGAIRSFQAAPGQDATTGLVLVENCIIDLDTSGQNTNGVNTITFGINLRSAGADSQTIVRNNTVKGCSSRCLLLMDNWGTQEVYENTLELTSWYPERTSGVLSLSASSVVPSPRGTQDGPEPLAGQRYHNNNPESAASFVWVDVFNRSSNPDQLGSLSMRDNIMYAPALDNNLFSFGGSSAVNSRPGPLVIIRNNGTLLNGHSIARVRGINKSYFGQNRVAGKGKVGFGIGLFLSRSLGGTDYNVLHGNNLSNYNATEQNLIFGPDAWNNTSIGGGNVPSAAVLFDDSGVNGNKVTGLKQSPQGGVGQSLSDLILKVKNTSEVLASSPDYSPEELE